MTCDTCLNGVDGAPGGACDGKCSEEQSTKVDVDKLKKTLIRKAHPERWNDRPAVIAEELESAYMVGYREAVENALDNALASRLSNAEPAEDALEIARKVRECQSNFEYYPPQRTWMTLTLEKAAAEIERFAQVRAEAVLDLEIARWQKAIYELVRRRSGSDIIDGGSCDSGDPLDFILSEIEQGFNILIDAAEQENAELREALQRVFDLDQSQMNSGEAWDIARAALARYADNARKEVQG